MARGKDTIDTELAEDTGVLGEDHELLECHLRVRGERRIFVAPTELELAQELGQPTGPDWLRTPFDGDRTLVEHRDLDAWLRGPRLEDALLGVRPPDSELLAGARTDFASILFREEIANDAR